jgi:DNA-binding protein HU-beta
VTKADIVDVIASATGLTKVETEAVVDGFIQTVINAMKEGKNIEIRGFGSKSWLTSTTSPSSKCRRS